MATFRLPLSPEQSVEVTNEAGQTTVRNEIRSPCSQQLSAASFMSGAFLRPPQYSQEGQEVFLLFTTDRKEHQVRIRGGEMSTGEFSFDRTRLREFPKEGDWKEDVGQSAAQPAINSGKLVWAGEHWINAIRPAGQTEPSAWFSLFHTRHSEAGEGNALQLVIPSAGIGLFAADNLGLGGWVKERFFARSSLQTPDAPLVEAKFAREGATCSEPAWVVEFGSHRVVAKWKVTEPPVIAYGPFRPGVEFFTLLFFTSESSVEADGRRIEGAPYLRDIWRPTIGGDRSSSVFALAETLIETVGEA